MIKKTAWASFKPMDKNSMIQAVQVMNQRAKEAEERRAIWRQVAKDVFKQLEQIAREVNQGVGEDSSQTVHVSSSPVLGDLLQLTFSFGSGPIGIKVPDRQGTSHIVDRGAHLMFIPMVEGKVMLNRVRSVLEYPENKGESGADEVVATVAPDSLTNLEELREHVGKFLVWASENHWTSPPKKKVVVL